MFINRIQTTFKYISKDYLIKDGTRELTYGKLQNGNRIAISNYIKDGKIVEKQYVIWNDKWQRIINKIRKPNGKGFQVIGQAFMSSFFFLALYSSISPEVNAVITGSVSLIKRAVVNIGNKNLVAPIILCMFFT